MNELSVAFSAPITDCLLIDGEANSWVEIVQTHSRTYILNLRGGRPQPGAAYESGE